MKKWLAVAGAAMMLATTQGARAWQPAGWVYHGHPWAYDSGADDWYWFAPDTQWVVNMGSGQWALLPQSAMASGWVYYEWPFAYAQANNAWHWINEPDEQWVVNMRTQQWSRYGHLALVLSDDFTGNLTDHWIPGRAANEGAGTHALTIEDNALRWVQNFDYIQSKAAFSGNIIVEIGYRGGPASFQKADFWIELVALTDATPPHDTAGMYRSQYGTQNYHAVNIGRSPSVQNSIVSDFILDPPHLQTLAPGSPREGTIRFMYAGQQVRMLFENNAGLTVSTAWVATGAFSETQVRIWGMGTPGGSRFIDYVRIYAGSTGAPPLPGGGYEFVKITDTESTDFTLLDQEPAINDAGTVAFWAETQPEVDGIYTGNGGGLTTVLHVTESGVQDIWGYKSINNSGAVAVQLQYFNNNTTIEVRDGVSAPAVIIAVADSGLTHLADPQLNNHGKVAFWGQQWAVGEDIFQGIYTGDGTGPVQTVADHTGGAAFARFAQRTSINDAGDVAYAARTDGGENVLYRTSGATRTVVAVPPGAGTLGDACVINSSGHVAYRMISVAPPHSGVYVWNGAATDERVRADMMGTTPFDFVQDAPALNDAGKIAFVGSHAGAANGLYTGPDPVADKVLERGDTLDGKVVNTVWVSRHGLNNNGQIAMFVMFEDGSLAIYRADPAGL